VTLTFKRLPLSRIEDAGINGSARPLQRWLGRFSPEKLSDRVACDHVIAVAGSARARAGDLQVDACRPCAAFSAASAASMDVHRTPNLTRAGSGDSTLERTKLEH
jgi:hypothetical protein